MANSAVTFERRWKRTGVFVNGMKVGEIESYRWGFGLDLSPIGVYWAGPDKTPARGGNAIRGFKRRRDAVGYVEREMPTLLAAANPKYLREKGLHPNE